MGTTPRTPASVFAWNGVPPAGQLIPLGLQHVVAAVVGVITPAIIVSSTCGLSDADTTLMIQVSLILTALATLLQLFPLFRRLGSGLPVIMGISFAYVPTLTSIGGAFGLGDHLGRRDRGRLRGRSLWDLSEADPAVFPGRWSPARSSLPSASPSTPLPSNIWPAARDSLTSEAGKTGW